MRLKQFINEDRGNELSSDDTKKLIQSKCKKAVEAYKKGSIIYRGVNIFDDFSYIQPSKFTRKSKNTKNFYTLINDNSPAWKDYPKRSKSIICSTNEHTAQFYGNVYIVFPFDGAKIGVCSSYDYWGSFPFLEKVTGIEDMDEFNRRLGSLLGKRLLPINKEMIKDYTGIGIDEAKTYKQIQNIFKKFDKFIKEYDAGDDESVLDVLINSYGHKKLLKEYDKFMNMEKYLQYLLDPKRNEFELKTIGDNLPSKRELWTDSDSILIRIDKINNVLS